MFPAFLALTALALTVSAPAQAADRRAAAAKRAAPKRAAPKPDAITPEEAPAPDLSASATRVADWVMSARDNRTLPYIIIDKPSAAAFLYDAKGKLLGHGPVLIGIMPGDDATPGIGSKSLSEIGPAEKTTPAGRYLAKFGVAAGKQRVLWVDYATSVALHTIPPGNPKEKRTERMLSPGIEDNRITFGCINVPKVFYAKVSPMFRKKGGYVYILPDTKPIEDVFPRLRVQPFLDARARDAGAVTTAE